MSNSFLDAAEVEKRLALCSWSVHPKDPADLVDQMKQIGIPRIQLMLSELMYQSPWSTVGESLRDAGIEIISGMVGCVGEDYSSPETIRRTGGVVPDATWPATLETMRRTAPLCPALGIKLVAFHAGFIPSDPKDAKVFDTVISRVGQVADLFGEHGVQVCLETGQEPAATLKRFIQTLGRTDVGVNFDPANMYLYRSGEPVAALAELISWVKQIHVKDAIPSDVSGQWGRETPVGDGKVNWIEFFDVLRRNSFQGNLVIEREGGDQRIADIRKAKQFLLRTADAN